MTPPGWYPDPFGRFQVRYWDGSEWTANVSTAGATAIDPPVGVPAPIVPASVVLPSPYGEYAPTPDERSTAMWCHLGPLLVSFLSCGVLAIVAWVVPLMILNGKGQTSRFVKLHATQSLNFFIEMLIAGAITGVLIFAFIGFVLFPIVVVWNIVFAIIATIQASSGKWYRIPLNLPLFS